MYKVGVVGLGNTAAMLDAGDLDTVAVNELGFAGIEISCMGWRIALPDTSRARRVFANG